MKFLSLKIFLRFGVTALLSASLGCGVLNVSTTPSTNTQSANGSGGGAGIGGNDSGSVGNGITGSGNDNGYVDTRTPAQLVITPASYNFSVQSLNSLNYATFTITNIGQKTAVNVGASGLSGAYSFRQGPYPGLNGNCTQTLDPGSTCQMVITFQPTTLQSFPLNSFVMQYDADVPDVQIPIPLTGAATDIATLQFSNVTDDNTFYDFGTLAYGTVVTKNVEVLYYGAQPATGVAFTGLTAPFAVLSNTCGSTVTANCNLMVQYTATSSGSEIIKVTYDNSSFTAEDNHTFTGTAASQVTPATLSIAGQGGNAYGRILPNTTLDRTFNVTKGGTLPATGVTAAAFTSGAFSFKGGSFPGTGGTCAASITANCTLVVTFAPTALQTYSDQVLLNFNNGQAATQASASISGQGAGAAVLSLTPADPVSFGSQPVHWGTNVQFTLTNSASGLSASAITIAQPGAPFNNLGGCGNSLSPGQSCNFTVQFLPTAVGTFSAPLTISYFDGNVVQTNLQRTLQGTGTGAAVLTSSNMNYNFGNVFVGNTASTRLTLNFYGADTATIQQISGMTGPFSFLGGNFPGTGGTCGNTLAANCSVVLAFAPTAAQAYQTTLGIQYDDGTGTGTSQTLSIHLSGTGVLRAPAVLKFVQAPLYDFGSVPMGQTKTASLTVQWVSGNYSASQMAGAGLGGDFSFVGGSYPGTGGNCGTSLASGTCTLMVSYQSVGNGLDGPTTLQLNYFDGVQNQTLSMQVQGEGTNLAVLTASAQVFPNVSITQSSDLTVTITNQGTRAASAVSLTGTLAAPFSLNNNQCGASLAVNATCTLSFHFAPTTPGIFQQAAAISYQNGTSSTNLNLNLQGSGIVPVLASANGNYSCARIPTGQMVCWGQNNYGQLGVGDANSRLTPGQSSAISLGTGRYPVQIATGYFHACALLDNGELKCWGLNLYGELGLEITQQTVGDQSGEMGDNLAAVNLGSGLTVKQIALGYAHSCVLFTSGVVKCWGDNSEGQLGYGDTNIRGLSAGDMGNNLPEVDLGGHLAVQISANTSHTCALLDDGGVKCWGNNFFGQLGLDDFQNRGDQAGEMGTALPEINLGTNHTALSISAGSAFTCAILDDASLKCWGRNENGILGNTYCQDVNSNTGPCSNPNYPIALRGYGINAGNMGDALPTIGLGTGRTVKNVQAANSSVCAILDDGTLKCWGQNQYGQLGLGDTNDRGDDLTTMGDALVPVSLSSSLYITSLAMGAYHGCAILTGDQMKCWGYNHYGQLGLGDTNNRGDAANEMGAALPFLTY